MNFGIVLFIILIMSVNAKSPEENNRDYEKTSKESDLHDYEEILAKEDDDYEEEVEIERPDPEDVASKQESSQKDHKDDYEKAASKQERHHGEREQIGIRTLFHEQGLKGPHSYRYGYDTGGNKNRMTKYEERDDKGYVRGSYSFTDPNGKLQIVNYEAHPKYGFRASGSFGTFPRRA